MSGYQYKRNKYLQDIDATQAPLAAGGRQVVDYYARHRQYSQEINILSPTEGAFDWILGGYYQQSDAAVDYLQISPLPPVFFVPRNNRKILGAFGQGNYKIAQAVELKLGLRYSHFKGTSAGSVLVGAGLPGFPPGGLPVADLSGSHNDGRVTGKAAINWEVDDDNLLYAFAARGYKPGGFAGARDFSPETVWSYEIGWKSTLADGRVRTQVNAFYNDYRGFQLDVLEPSTGVSSVWNANSTTIKGVEAQVQGRFGGFSFDGAVGYVDSRLDGLTFVDERRLPPGQLGPQCPPGVPSNRRVASTTRRLISQPMGVRISTRRNGRSTLVQNIAFSSGKRHSRHV